MENENPVIYSNYVDLNLHFYPMYADLPHFKARKHIRTERNGMYFKG